MENVAIYAGTFDPVTYGHIDVIERASKLFDQVIVGIAVNPNKKPLFTLDERVSLTAQVLGELKNIDVFGFDSLLLDFAKKHKAGVILRGLRTVTDFDYEFQLASMNRHLNPKIETLFLMPAERFMCISSSLVREIASLGGDVSSFVPKIIAQALFDKFKSITGIHSS